MEAEIILKRIRQVSQLFITAMSVFSLVALASCVVTFTATGKASIFGYRVMWVRTPSMEPAIMTGDFVLVKTATERDVDVGDIVVYRKTDSRGRPSHYRIIHRITELTEDGNFILKGDNNPSPDKLEVTPDQVEYKAVYVF